MSIDIANESGLEVSEADLAALARYVLDQMRINPLAELSVLLVDESAMADLHQRWMGEHGPTDVLAFPMDELRPPPFGGGSGSSMGKAGGREPEREPGLLGDVVLCPQIAARQAQAAGHSTQDEIELLCTHGILHLLGYDHADPREHATMFGVQERLLASWHASGRGGDMQMTDPAGEQPAGETLAGKPADGAAVEDGGGQEGPG
ncbi:MAG: rRNA maturation RNase YbeY [Micromonosporaceae bacterium]